MKISSFVGDGIQKRVAVFGLGYVGCVTAACLAKLGHQVIGVDKDEHKVRSLVSGRAPFFEPGLDELIASSVAGGKLSATTSAATALLDVDLALICVGTPSRRDGTLALDHLERVSSEIAEGIRSGSKGSPVVAVRSTIFPGTCEQVVIPRLAACRASVIVHPEFMREGNAINDFLQPPLLVFGGSDVRALQCVAALYSTLPVEPTYVSLRTAEMIKHACNAFHALKIGFANEIGTLCGQLGIDGNEVMETVCHDRTLNISAAYLKPGLAFGGSCLPKDLRAIVHRARHENLRLPLVESVLPSNDEHLRRSIQAILDFPQGRIGIFGLAFKENTDDLRESPVISILEQLIGKGREVRVFDPHIRLEQIYGTNLQFVLSAIPHIARLLDDDLEQMIRWADYLIVTQRPSSEHAQLIGRSNREILDLTRAPCSDAQVQPLGVP